MTESEASTIRATAKGDKSSQFFVFFDRLYDTFATSATASVVLVFMCSLAMFYHYQSLSPYIPGTDGYYHIKFAYLMRTEGFLKVFKWASMSIWSETFYDKEFLFHVYLIPFTYFKDLAYGAKLGTAILAATSVTSFFAILRLNRIKFASLWWLMLMCSGGYFLYRNNVPRPQVLSIILALWSIHFIINQKRIALFLLGVVYTLSYTAYFLPVVFSGIISGYLFIFEDDLDWKTPAVTLGAMAVGILINPYFPNNLVYLYLQNFYVLWMSTQNKVNLRMGNELGPMSTRELLGGNAAAVIAYIGVFFMALYRPKQVSKTVRSMFFLSLAVILLTFHTKRFTEYSVPITLMFCAFFFHPYLVDLDLKQAWEEQRSMVVGWIGVLVMLFISLGIGSYIGTSRQFKGSAPAHKGAALYLKKHTKKDEVVFTCDWDDGPELIFFNHHNRYLIFLDPNFMYFWKPKLWVKWDKLAHGRFGNKTHDILKKDFKVRYGVCTREFGDLRSLIKRDKQIKIVFEKDGAYVFKLKE